MITVGSLCSYPWGLLLYPDPAEVETVQRLEGHSMSMSQITYVQLSQLTIISLIGVLLGLAATMMAPFFTLIVSFLYDPEDNLQHLSCFILDLYFVWCLVLVKIKSRSNRSHWRKWR